MYSKFFENGLTEEALDRACDHALSKIEEKVSFLVGAQIYSLRMAFRANNYTMGIDPYKEEE